MKTEFRMQNAECGMRNPASRIAQSASRFTFHVSHSTSPLRNNAREDVHHVSRFTFHASRQPSRITRPLERGVALVITLVLLTIITFMAVTFLVVSRSQHGSVSTETDQAVARLAADAARERAIAQLLAPMMAWTNEQNYGLLVSTNYINPGGYISGVRSPLNVSYNYPNGAPLTPIECHHKHRQPALRPPPAGVRCHQRLRFQ